MNRQLRLLPIPAEIRTSPTTLPHHDANILRSPESSTTCSSQPDQPLQGHHHHRQADPTPQLPVLEEEAGGRGRRSERVTPIRWRRRRRRRTTIRNTIPSLRVVGQPQPRVVKPHGATPANIRLGDRAKTEGVRRHPSGRISDSTTKSPPSDHTSQKSLSLSLLIQGPLVQEWARQKGRWLDSEGTRSQKTHWIRGINSSHNSQASFDDTPKNSKSAKYAGQTKNDNGQKGYTQWTLDEKLNISWEGQTWPDRELQKASKCDLKSDVTPTMWQPIYMPPPWVHDLSSIKE